MSRPPLLVRVGVRYFQRLSRASGRVDAGDGVHFLNPDERAALRRVERGAVWRAGIAGALSTAVAAAVEVLATPVLLGPRPKHASTSQQIAFWAVVGSVTVVASVIEILYLYWDGLRSVHRLAREAGLDLFPQASEESALAGAMARAALELPNPATPLFGVNPYREASRTRLFVASLIYKAKITVTNFVIKALVRRMLGRAAVRAWLPFVAVPFTAAWNMLVCWQIMREARIRAMGPSAAHEMMSVVFRDDDVLRPEAASVAMRAVASSIVRTEDLHPNLIALLEEVAVRSGARSTRQRVADTDLDDTRIFLAELAALTKDEQSVVLRVLAVSAIMDGRITRREASLLREARLACARDADLSGVHALRRAFLAGDALDRALLNAL